MNDRLTEGQGGDPLRQERNRLARDAALAAARALAEPEAADSVGYRSRGNTLVVGRGADALPLAERLAQTLPVTVLLLDGATPVRAVALTGWLGAFEAHWQAPGQPAREGHFDLVLDLCLSPLITSHQHPHGYYAPGPDDQARAGAVDALLEMVGEFEKPKYFAYRENLCAHSRNARTGCNACIEICSARAISPAGERIKVNPYLCAGCGACTTVCPTGALGYAYPPPVFTGLRLQTALRAYHEAGGADPLILLHSADEGAALLEALATQGDAIAGRVLPFALHHVASAGIDVWLAALAYGASGVAVLMTGTEAPQYVAALEHQMAIAQAILSGLGYAGPHLQLLRANTPPVLAHALEHAPAGQVPRQAATFKLAASKRNTLDYALAHLYRHAPRQPQAVPLPVGAPFGALELDKQACSLCMACVGACPSSALVDGQNLPQLRFIEKNCVQCGLCVNTCPEHAISLVPRMTFAASSNQAVVLNETQPFHCIRCDKPFGTLVMIETMLAKLSSHAAFAANLDRIRMCGDCRVIDMMQAEQEATITDLRRV
jgi:ferredoxin